MKDSLITHVIVFLASAFYMTIWTVIFILENIN